MAATTLVPAMEDVPASTNEDGVVSTPSASMPAMASEAPTLTGTPGRSRPSAHAPAGVSGPRSDQAAARGGTTDVGQLVASTPRSAGAAVRTWHSPLLDHGSDNGDPVKTSPR